MEQNVLVFKPIQNNPFNEVWKPIGARYYGEELIGQPEPRWNLVEQLQLLNWHPLFTGRCPECEVPILQTDPLRVHGDCFNFGWVDDSL